MFTLEQINDAHDRLGNAATLAAYLRELNSIGAESFYVVCARRPLQVFRQWRVLP